MQSAPAPSVCRAVLICVLLIMRASAATAVVSLQASSVTVDAPGDSAELCVSLSTGGAEVAGTQNDLNWDGDCASLRSENDCAVAGMHSKELHAATRCGDFCLRAILLSLSDVDPIPDGALYCCRFTVDAAPGQCCSVSVTNSAASDPEGKAISVDGEGAHLCVASDGQIGTPTPTPTAAPFSEDDGCQVSRTHAHAGVAPSFVVTGLLWLVRRLAAKATRRRSTAA